MINIYSKKYDYIRFTSLMPLSFYIDNELINGFKLTIAMCKDYTLVKSLYLKTQKKASKSIDSGGFSFFKYYLMFLSTT